MYVYIYIYIYILHTYIYIYNSLIRRVRPDPYRRLDCSTAPSCIGIQGSVDCVRPGMPGCGLIESRLT